MMHGYGYGYGWDDMMTSSGSFLNGTGWMVIPMMGIGFLLIVGVIVWLAWSQRQALGLSGPYAGGQQYVSRQDVGMTPGAESSIGTVEEIARRRYANGEISADEYRTIIATLAERR